ncbi:BACON domain-containing protein [Ktedonobacter racemifer]|uniref:BACON domain-containing protein n=1 Tax=Ktedonobacter racemifer DSM 44963 TaxID=485913 RepID=D6THN2_KTERA|nr:zinc ribbon domain-containing protein [Ktedonobacter racemifer]EFH89037.1 hypothetical protein Krac_10560 [Ktedonobacter racemifer DSM 44963]
MMHCKHCGTLNPAEAGFCGNCGKNLEQLASDDFTRQRNPVLQADALTQISGPHIPISSSNPATPPPAYTTPPTTPITPMHRPTPFPASTPEEEEEERRKRAALLGLPLIGAAFEQAPNNVPTIQGTPSQPGIPGANGTPNMPSPMSNMQAGLMPGPGGNFTPGGLPTVAQPPISLPPPVYTPPTSSPQPGPPGSPQPTTPPSHPGCLSWLLIALTVLVILASIGTLGLVLFTPALSLDGASVVQVGNTYQLSGQGFLPGTSVTLTLDGNTPILFAAGSPPGSVRQTHMQVGNVLSTQHPTLGSNTLTVSALGTFKVSLHIDNTWHPGKHTIQASGSSVQHTASLEVTVTQNGVHLPTPTTTATSTPTTTDTPTGTDTPVPTDTPATTDTPASNPPALDVVNPASVSLSATAGSNQSTTATVTLTTRGSGTLTWQSSWNASWLNVYPSQGQIEAPGTQTIQVSANASQLKAGTYTTSVVFSSQASSSYSTLTVTLTVKAATVVCINTSPTSIAMKSVNGGMDRAQITLTNCGNVSSDWSATSSATWLNLSLSSGTLSAGQQATTLATAPNRVQLKDGTYIGYLTFTSGSKQVTVTVTLTVSTIIT